MYLPCILTLLLSLSSCYQREDNVLEGPKKMIFLSKLERSREINSMYLNYKKEFPNISDLEVSEIDLNDRDLLLVDVREDYEREVSFIENSINLDEFEENLDKYKNKKIIFYCTIGYRSGLVTKDFMEEGLHVYNLIGGVLSWANTGKTFLDNQALISKTVHVYGKKWNILPPDYSAIY